MKKLSLLLLFTLLLTSCGEDIPVVEKIEEKQTFFIETLTVAELGNTYNIKKSAKILSSSQINLTSQTTGKVNSILVKEGDKVYKGQELVYITDSVSNLGLELRQAKLNLEKSKISRDSTQISLDKSVADAKLNLKNLQTNFELTKQRNKLSLDKSEISLEKFELDYQNTLIANKEQITSYIDTSKSEYNEIILDLTDIIEFADKIFGHTIENQNSNNAFENYLGAKDSTQKYQTIQSLKDLITYKQELDIFNPSTISEENIIVSLEKYEEGYRLITKLLDGLEIVFFNSVTSVGALDDATINTYIASINGYQSINQIDASTLSASKNAISTFLTTYKDKEYSQLKALELSRIDNVSEAENSISLSVKESLFAIETQMESAQLNYDNAIKNRDVTLKSLNNSIGNAVLNVERAGKNYGKLTLRASVAGTISSVGVDVGQEYPAGTSIVKIISDGENEIEVFLANNELDKVKNGDDVSVSYLGKSFSGSVYSKSSLADVNLNYSVKIRMDDSVELVGSVADVTFQATSNNKLLPLNSVRVINSNTGMKQGEIKVFGDDVIKKETVELGIIFGNMIELLSDLPNETEIVISDVKNYDETKFELQIK